ncbi:MAG: nucleotidyltransferase domain-containing protein [Thiobacillus sp.]|nr:nucleotidyltransferase domain-containing protein [Thiobacillus sp.]
MPRFTELSLSAQTAYAQLFDAASAAELSRSVANLAGSFAQKTVKGRVYWYFQHTDLAGITRQIYVGPDTPEVRRLVELRANAPGADALRALARSAIALGCQPLVARHFRVIRRLLDHGFFKAGGVLVGTHAFLAYGNLLGVSWGDTSRTQDVDFAHAGKSLSIALPSNIEVDVHRAIESLEMGFLPVSSLAGKAGATYLNPKEPDFRLDFLTPRHRGGDAPIEHPRLHVTMQPLRFIEYSLENIVQVALFSAEGTGVVNVPHPARYALHKLLIYGERSGSFTQKANKDLAQAAALLGWFKIYRPWEVEEAWQDMVNRGKGWVSRVERGIKALDRWAPELGVADWLKRP